MKFNYILLSVIFFSVISCRTIKQLEVKKEVPAITENKLLKNIEGNRLDYNTLFIKRADISLSNQKGSNNFKASFKIQRDSFIQVSVTAPLGIEVARILLTNDSIKFVDIYHKRYFFADYNYFYEKYDVHLGFGCIQKILTNTFFNLEDCVGLETTKKYKLDRTESAYELSTVEERALSRKIKKLYKKRRKNKDFILILQKILIDPQTYRPLLMSVEDVEEETGVSVTYESFKDFSGKIFPDKVIFKLFSMHDRANLELKIQKLEFNVPVEPNLKISSKYKRID